MRLLPEQAGPIQVTDATVALTQEHERRFAILRNRLRKAAYRLVADCERLLDEPMVTSRAVLRDAIGKALTESRRLIALTTQYDGRSGRLHSDETQLTAAAQEVRDVVLNAMNGILGLVAVSTDEEMLLRDIRAVRDGVRQLIGSGATDDDAPQSEAAAAPAAAAAPRTFRVLVADDEEHLRDLVARSIDAMGHEVIKAKDGQEALDVALREPVDLILTDINMPRLDGRRLLQELKSRAETKDIPVIVVSSESEMTGIAQVIEWGAEDHIVKPYQPLLLRARVVASLERKRLRDEELDHLRRVGQLTAAAEAVESESYVAGSLNRVADGGDALAKLARVFDRMVTGLKSREARLQRRLGKLKHELRDSRTDVSVVSASDDSPFATAQVVASRYEIEGQLGKGGMGMVYRARDLELGEEVAIKVIRGELVKKDPAVLERLKSEIRLARKISHRNVVRLHDLGEYDGVYFITMEYVKGVTVADLLDKRGRLTVESTLAIGTQLCEALAVAHDAQIIHRDIKPANLLVDSEGGLKVMDFGIARSIDQDALRLTTGGLVVGTPQYMAPEQLLGRPVDARADLFAVGNVLYECLSGRPPYIADSPMGLMTEIAEGNLTPLGALVPDVPRRLAALIHQQLKFEASERAQSAAELGGRLAEIEGVVE